MINKQLDPTEFDDDRISIQERWMGENDNYTNKNAIRYSYN